jgi:cytochrome c553
MTPTDRVPDAAQRAAELRAEPRAGHAAGIVLAAVLVVLGCSAADAAGDVSAGRRKALQCQTCHGLDGLFKLPEAPHLAGQPEPYLVKSLNDYRTGSAATT